MENGIPVIKQTDGTNWDVLVQRRIIEYVDCSEVDQAVIAMDMNDVGRGYKNDYIELSPAMMLGVMASIIPFPASSQSPRNCYQCLDPDELVVMGDNTLKPIKDIKVGEHVITVDPITCKQSVTAVVNQYVKHTDKCIITLTTETGRKLRCTYDHPVLSSKGWVRAELADDICVVADYFEDFLENEYSMYIKHTRNTHVSFINWLNSVVTRHNTVFVKVQNCSVNRQGGLVADITTESDNHSFITGDSLCVHNSAMGKQAIGMFATSFQHRTDTIVHVLDYPQRPFVSTIPSQIMGFSDMPSGINAIVAIASYSGFNQEDSILMNKSAIERGLFCVTTYKTISEEERKHSINGMESICLPAVSIRKREANYGLLDENGVVRKRINRKNVYVNKGDVIIGKTITKSQKVVSDEHITDCSVIIKAGEEGYIDRIINTLTPNGYRMVKIVIRTHRIPEVGDKFASRSAQKGVIGMIYRQEDMPFTAEGITPDLVINPHAIPSRMTINQLMECILGKSCALDAKDGGRGDATPFTKNSKDIANELCDRLAANGFDRHGWERMYNGMTGEPLASRIFIGPTYYQRLKHMVSDKLHCLTEDHDVLTKHGWKKISEITKSDKVATLHNGKNLVYEHPKSCLSFFAIERYLYNIKSECIDIVTTEEHRMWIAPENNGKISEYNFKRANELANFTGAYKHNANWNASDYMYNDCTYDEMEHFIILLGLWYGNGISVHAMDKILFVCNNSRMYALFKVTAEALSTEYVISENIARISDSGLHNYFKTYGNTIPKWMMKMSKNQAAAFIGATMINNNDGLLLENKNIADGMQQLCLHAGFTGIVVPDICKNPILKVIINNPIVNHSKRYGTYTKYKSTEKVFCLQVPSEIFYVRRNGKCVWTGNSRSSGHITTLTRQPLEGRSREGGLRFGEMERDAIIAHGVSRFLKERLFDKSDPYQVTICDTCGCISTTPTECKRCETNMVSKCNLPYAAKLLLQELNAMNIKTSIKVKK
jgi:hypothetical protein